MKSSNNLVGTAGEYFVCAELCRRGYLALLTPKNNPIFDVIASTEDGRRTISIQVKTRSMHNDLGWKLGKNIVDSRDDPNLFVVLVNLEQEGLPEFYVYEHNILAAIVEGNYRKYLAQPKRDGTPRKDVDFRWHDRNMFTDDDHRRRNNWTPIEDILAQQSH